MNGPTIKICGVTRVEDAERAVALGAGMLGLNFYPPSPRALSVERAREIADSVRGRVRLVGVFVDRAAAEVEEIGDRVGLDLFQFHGDEPPEAIAPFGRRAIKAFRLDGSGSPDGWRDYPEAWGFLFEGRHPSLYGGTGESWSYQRLASIETDRPVLVAGGIRPGNARRALELSGASGLDVCSGVESEPGVKDPVLLSKLFAELRIADSE